jgi:hypothetical protein
MSGRLFKKVLKEQEEEAAAVQQNTDLDGVDQLSPDEDESDSPAPSSSKNPFDLLDDDDDIQENDSDNDKEQPTAKIDKKEFSPVKAPVAAISTSNNHKSKKMKKKKVKDVSASDKLKAEDTSDLFENLSIGASSSSNQQDLSKVRPTNVKVVHNKAMKQFATSSLQVDSKLLSAENELRRIFGSKVVNSFEKSQQTGSSRNIRGGRRGSHNHRKTILVSSSDHWGRWDGSMSMECLGTENGYNNFRYVHSASYSQAQRAFEAAQAINDLNGVASVLLYHPYHIDSLVTLSEYFKFSGEHQMSADSTAKILYAFECAWSPMFTPLQGNSQLKYTHESNKPFLDTLFVHMKNMDRRGCHRCALEICKFLLSLDSDDPKGALFCIDYFALRAEEYLWLEQFSEEYKSDNSLWLFPNFSFSLAIARFNLEKSEDSKKDDGKASSVELMKQALMLHPPVLKKMVEKVPLKDQAWTNILKHRFFASNQTGNPTLDHLVMIYVEKNYLIWRLPDLQKLLRDCALEVIQTLDNDKSVAKDWLCVRKEAFPSDKNDYSHLLVSDFSDAVPTMPPEILQNFMVDPRMLQEMQNGGGHRRHVAHEQVLLDPLPRDAAFAPPTPRDVANRNTLAVLFESMLPWVDFGRAEEEPHDGNLNNHNDDE